MLSSIKYDWLRVVIAHVSMHLCINSREVQGRLQGSYIFYMSLFEYLLGRNSKQSRVPAEQVEGKEFTKETFPSMREFRALSFAHSAPRSG